MPEQGAGAGDRLALFIESYGVGGVAVLIIFAVLGTIFILLRGPGFALLLLASAYTLSFVQEGGVSIAAFFIRILTLVMLTTGALRRIVTPRWQFYALIGYVLLGLLFSAASPSPVTAIQKAFLLLLTTLALTLGVGSFLRSWDSFHTLFRVFALSGVVWVVASIPAIGEFVSGETLRFTGGSELHATGYANSGGLTIPFCVWALIQRKALIWRLVGLVGVIMIPILLFLSGTRTAIVVGILASAPLLFHGGGARTMRVWLLLSVGAFGAVLVSNALLSGTNTEFLSARLSSTSLSGREALWSQGLRICLASPLIGRGIGANDWLAQESGAGIFHNAYLSIWCNTGLVGLGLVVAAVASQALSALTMLRRAKDPMAKDALKLGLGFLVAILAMGMVRNSFASPSNSVIAMLLLMVTVVSRAKDLIEEEERNPAALQRPLPGPGFVTPALQPGLPSVGS